MKLMRQSCAVYVTLLLLAATLFSSVYAEKSETYTLQHTYYFEPPHIQKICLNGTFYDSVLLPDGDEVFKAGEPNLPARGAYLLLPPGMTDISIDVTSNKMVYLGQDYEIASSQKPVPLSQKNINVFTPPNTALYNSNELFPKKLFTKIGTYSCRGYTILVLTLYPVRYVASTGGLYYYQSFDISVELKETSDKNDYFRSINADEDIILQKIDNPSLLSSYSTCPSDVNDPLWGYDVLLITTDDFAFAFQELADHHNDLGIGYRTSVKTLSDIGSCEPEAIRDYIRQEYIENFIWYVLIGGDQDSIPAPLLWVDSQVGPMTEMPSDLYYACLDGPYNYDSDDKWGEPTDGEDGGDVDLMAEVYVGRACVDTIDEVHHFVNKTIHYMDTRPPYLKHVATVGESLDATTWGGDYMDELINGSSNNGYTTVGIPDGPSGMNISTLYDRDWPGYHWPSSEIIGYINNETHIINHIGHASPEQVMRMNNDYVTALTNEQYFFMYTQGCHAGAYDFDDCIAEWFTVKTSHGAFSAIMNARYGWAKTGNTNGPSQRFHREFWDAVFDEEIAVISAANQDSKEDTVHLINQYCMRWCYYELHLFGDPCVDLNIYLGPKIPHLQIRNITGGMDIKAEIGNVGGDATDVKWTIKASGGMLGLVRNIEDGTIPYLGSGEQTTVTLPRTFGFGKISISVEASVFYGENQQFIVVKSAKGFVFLFYVFIPT
jgi:hypothetical protein